MIKNAIANWRTTSVGLTSIIGSIVHLIFAVKAGTANENTWTISIGGIVGGVGLLLAGDASRSAKEVDKLAEQTKTAIDTGDTSHITKPTDTQTKG